MIFGFMWVAGLAVLVLMPLSARATIYECLDASGAKVLTDTPAQLKNCIPMSAGPAVPGTRLPAAVQEPAGVVPSLAPTLPRAPSEVSTMPPSEPIEPEPLPGADDELPPSGQAPPSLQPCRPGFNPMNPLGSVNCPPGPSSPGAATPIPNR